VPETTVSLVLTVRLICQGTPWQIHADGMQVQVQMYDGDGGR